MIFSRTVGGPASLVGARTEGGMGAGSEWGVPDCVPETEPRASVPVPDPGCANGRDRGSLTPLVIGMMVCLLVLTAGVTAAGSAFLAGQRLQRLCDGAVAAAVGAVNPQRTSAQGVAVSDPIAAANEYLRVRGPDVGAVISLGADTVNAQCSNEAPITFGALFGSPTLARTVTSTSEPIRNENALDSSDNARPFGLEGSLI